MQIKWGRAENILNEITSRREEFKQNGTYEGDFTEKSSVIYFNRNPSNFKNYIKEIHGLISTTYLVRVTTKQYSKLSKQKVFTRADAYAITIKDNDLLEALEENEYYLDEDFLQSYSNSYEVISYSGISIKIADSDSYQILKLTPNSFNDLFKNYSLGAGASVFCNKLEELPKNLELLKGWNCSIEDLQKALPQLNITKNTITSSQEICKEIKNLSAEIIIKTINSDGDKQKIIFNGIGIYEEPYTAYYFMQTYIIIKLTYIPFAITTGSGRSRGDYSLVLKPIKSFKLSDKSNI